MNTSLKIRLLLFLLTSSFIVTALTADLTLHKSDILQADAPKIERRLHTKERFIKDFLNDTSNFRKLKSIDKNGALAIQLIPDFKNTNAIYLFTYRNNKLFFWGTNRLILESDIALKEGSNIVRWHNGWYEGIKRSSGNFSAVFFIPIKSAYPFENIFLKNEFDPDLISSNNLEIANLTDNQVYNIRNNDGKYLFSVKVIRSVSNILYLELGLWILAVVFGCIFMNSLFEWIASKGYIKTSIALFFIFLFLLRVLDLKTNYFYTHFDIQILRPRTDVANFLYPSLGAFFLNLVTFLWFLAFTYSYRFKIKLSQSPLGKPVNYMLFILLGTFIGSVAFLVNDAFYDLINNTAINIDLTNVLGLNWLSWLGILMLCICVLNLYLLLEILLIIGAELDLSNRERLIIFLAGLGLVFLTELFLKDLSIFFLLFGLIIFLRAWSMYKNNNIFNLNILVLIILVFAILASVKLSFFQFHKEREQRKVIAKRLESADDPNTVTLFPGLEQSIINDSLIADLFKTPNKANISLKDYLKKSYFNNYLSRYNLAIFEYKPLDNFSERNQATLEYYKKLVISGSTKVSDYFYRNNNAFGFQNYFSLLPVKQDNEVFGTLVIELKSKTLQDPYAFPPVLANERSKPDSIKSSKYSFAYYKEDHLVNQYGDYTYNLINNEFKAKVGDFIFIDNLNGYDHVIYHLKAKRLIIVSKPVMNWVMYLASVSFLFLVLIIFTVFVSSIHWLWLTLNDRNIKINNFSWKYILSKNHILYKTRIQASMVAATVITLIIIGCITYFSINYQYRLQQQDIVRKRVNQISEGIENLMMQNGALQYNEQLLNAFIDINTSELNLYSLNGNLLFTTEPKIYQNSLLASKMNALAYIYLSKYQRSEYLAQERIGGLQFISAYKPIRNNHNETIAYLNVPNLSNEKDFEERIGQFLNTLINVYALLCVAIGFFAVFIANKITYPLTLVQKSLSETKIGRKNEPILWDRDDEIGGLIKEYNKMIVALEESAQKFARSERETAWKEMAKQVAHEIKNPLTPLKLGVQLLEKSWKENDPNFNKKFEKFSKSFIEQIESLSHIASEFSNFAKMPDTVLEDVNFRDVIEQVIEVFQPVNHITITLHDHTRPDLLIKGDRDQLLRSFNNLVKNAIEAIPDSRKGNIEIVIEEVGAHIQIQIIDNGKGIPEGLRERIFNPNFTTKSSGTGLGLAFVKQAIENMMGTIRFETEPDKGTKFYITLPIATT